MRHAEKSLLPGGHNSNHHHELNNQAARFYYGRHRHPDAKRAERLLSPVKLAIGLTLALVTLLVFHCTRGPRGASSGYTLQETEEEEVLAETDYLGRARQILKRVPLIDGHNDLPIRLQAAYGGKLANVNLTDLPGFHTDLTRLKAGGVSGQFWSGFIPCRQDFTRYSDDVRFTLEQIDLVHRIVDSAPDNALEFARTAADIRRIHKSGRLASLIGLEGGHQIDNSLGALRQFYILGVRYLTLTHVCNTAWADSAGAPGPPLHGGLDPTFGRAVVAEMNRLGMMVDLSHVSHDTMRDVLNITRAPVLFSHSSAHALCRITRNVPDDVLVRLNATDGVVMVNFYPRFVSCGPESTLAAVADHIEHIARVAGWKHVGLGSDFDGIDVVPVGLEDVSKYPDLIAELLRRGATTKQVEGVVGENLLRVMEGVEKAAHGLRRLAPSEATLAMNKTC
ncbi:dipeptidase 1 (renal) [Geranomyces michiganensis]|nr:dipeptidase 1 (renal) [Geranomyces michiganensis]